MKAAVAGSTGFIGSILLDFLKSEDDFEQIIVLSRKPLDLSSKFQVLQSEDIAEQNLKNVDVAFCALGTTISKAGSKEAFYHVDHDLVLAFATNVKKAGATTFVLVSSVGADSTSSNFYLKVKGDIEQAVEKLGFESLIILRPSMLMGERKEFRFGELIGKGFMTLFNPLMIGSMTKYRGIQGKTVAKAMIRLAKENLRGTHVLEGADLFGFS